MGGSPSAEAPEGRSGLAAGWLLLLTTMMLMSLFAARSWAIPPEDELTIVSVLDASGGSIVPVPVYVRDRSGTPVGGDTPPGRTIQGISISVALSPPGLVSSIEFQRAGVAVAALPMLEQSQFGTDVYSWIAMFDEATDPLPLSTDPAAPGDLIGHLLVGLPPLPPGTEIQLNLLADYCSLANRSGSLIEKEGSRLVLTSGVVGVGVLLFEDGFETGTTAAWDNTSP